MMLIDTHCHLYLPEFDEDREKMFERAEEVGVKNFMLPNIDSSSVESLLRLSENHLSCFPMMGLHPCSVKENWKDEAAIAENYLFKQPEIKFYGIGETGLDYFWDKTF